MTANEKKYLKLCLFLAFAGAVAYGIFFTPQGDRLLSPEGRKEMIGWMDHHVQSAGPFGPFLFILLYILGVQALPATPFSAAGAFLFGKFLGSVCNTVGATLGAVLSFFLGRYLLRDFARDLLIGKLGELDRKAAKHGFPVIFYLRIFWFPFIFLNYGAGATRIRFRDYFWGTFLGTTPAIVISTLFFGGIREVIASYRQPSDLLTFDILFPAALLGISFFLPTAVRRIRGEQATGRAGPE